MMDKKLKVDVIITKEQLLDHITDWNQKDILDFIKDIDETLDDWRFTIKLWLYLDRVIKKCTKDYCLEPLINELSTVDVK
jgi:hypothetical protein